MDKRAGYASTLMWGALRLTPTIAKHIHCIDQYRMVGNVCGYKFSRNRPKFRFQKFLRF